jgi:hypothetical protein
MNNDEFSDKNGRCINKSFAQSIVDSVKSGGNAVVEKFATQHSCPPANLPLHGQDQRRIKVQFLNLALSYLMLF